MTVVIVQCRLGSTRLHQKGVLPLDGKPLITWTLDAMKKVPADFYYLATDEESAPTLRTVATACGWELYAGSADNVLRRFCDVINLTHADTVVRATGDNPFLFYEAAIDSLNEFKFSDCDYFTYTGLPHGSGVEIYKASALLKANQKSTDPFEQEHVGPALYNHKDEYKVQFSEAPKNYNYSNFRTTVDTLSDYFKAQRVVRFLQSEYQTCFPPYTTKQIIKAFSSDVVNFPVLLVPSIKVGRGTGHFRRCLAIAKITGAHILIEKNEMMPEISELLTDDITIINTLPETYSYGLIITDSFALEKDEIKKYAAHSCLASIDEGSPYTAYCDFLLDIIPSLKNVRDANQTNPAFIELPKNRKPENSKKAINSVFVALGGEDPASLTEPAANACNDLGLEVRSLLKPIPNLREELYKYDLVITHYGFTAFEAAVAGCAVILLETTPLHSQLAKKYGYVCVSKRKLNSQTIKKILDNPEKLYPNSPELKAMQTESITLPAFINDLSTGRHYDCPICGKQQSFDIPNLVIARTTDKTIRCCRHCSILYISWSMQPEKKYVKNYFFDEYRNQYGKTYLDDFTSIKMQGFRRLKNIIGITKKADKSVLDIGCAYGPFLSAAKDMGFNAYGTDISSDAIKYVKKTLSIPAATAGFPDFDSEKLFTAKKFDVVTMWYVIEHFSELDLVLKTVNKLLPKGGVFAFSTPSAQGVSRRFTPTTFFKQSPADHYTLWEPSKAKKILKRYGFKVLKIVSTGHHMERLPISNKKKNNTFLMNFLSILSKLFKLGDTCEVYCKKIEDN